MVKVVRPLFSDSAVGRIGNIGAFRRSKDGTQFIPITTPTDRKTVKQLQLRACFSAAKKAHADVPRQYRIDWPVYWRQWLVDHPGCRS